MDLILNILCLILFLQVTAILTLINPLCDPSIIAYKSQRNLSRYSKSFLYVLAISHVTFVSIFGICHPLLRISTLAFETQNHSFAKFMMVSEAEKLFMISGFSLFLSVVIVGIKNMMEYSLKLTACITESHRETNIIRPTKRVAKERNNHQNILASVLKLKKSTSYENFLFNSDLTDSLRMLVLGKTLD